MLWCFLSTYDFGPGVGKWSCTGSWIESEWQMETNWWDKQRAVSEDKNRTSENMASFSVSLFHLDFLPGRLSVFVSCRHMPLNMGFHLFPFLYLPFLFLRPVCTRVVVVTLCLSVTLVLGLSLLSLTLSLRPFPFVMQGTCSNQVLLSNSRRTILTHLVCHFIVAMSFFNM